MNERRDLGGYEAIYALAMLALSKKDQAWLFPSFFFAVRTPSLGSQYSYKKQTSKLQHI